MVSCIFGSARVPGSSSLLLSRQAPDVLRHFLLDGSVLQAKRQCFFNRCNWIEFSCSRCMRFYTYNGAFHCKLHTEIVVRWEDRQWVFCSRIIMYFSAMMPELVRIDKSVIHWVTHPERFIEDKDIGLTCHWWLPSSSCMDNRDIGYWFIVISIRRDIKLFSCIL